MLNSFAGNAEEQQEENLCSAKIRNGGDGEKMSKSRGNVINPNDIIDAYGADTLRAYVMFIGEYEKPAIWSDSSVKGCKRFLDRVCDFRIWSVMSRVTQESCITYA